ncbi:hypothetical protein OB962_19295 [Aeromonas piscicola]|uniref:Uncharacterized protein n=1 Tax=Aeromonas piscicola TaxID=600645 RepID=A0ABT7QGM5_9GAMM|nr:hypothetical protein [Aeromonas piscicola]MDM5133119.1 hypothetical protein [Aeromonas piscicola]
MGREAQAIPLYRQAIALWG